MDVGSNKSRKDTRAVVSLIARYRSPSTFEYVQEACCDVSVGGMFIKSNDPSAAGTLLKLECEADTSGDKIRGVARVVWLRREANEYGPSGMGVKFVKLEPGCRETITRIVQENSAAGIEPQSMSSAPESRGKPPAARNKDNGKSNPTTAAAVHAAVPPAAPSPAPAPTAPAATPPAAAPPAASPAPAPAPSPRPAIVHAEAPALTHDTSLSAQRTSKPEVVAEIPRSAIDTRSASVPPVQPLAPEPKRGGVRVWWLVAVAAAALWLYFSSKKDTGSQVETSPAAPTAAAPTPTQEPSAPEAAEAKPQAPPAAPDTPPVEAAPTPEANKPEPAAAEAEAKPVEQAEPAAAAAPGAEPAAANSEAKPGAESAASPQPSAASAAQPTAAAPDPAAPPSAAAPAHPALPPGQLPYILSFVTRPSGATVTIGTQTIVAPGEMDLGAMPPRVKVTAQKEGYESSSVWLDRETEIVRTPTAIRRKVYLTLPPLKTAADAPKP